MLLHHKKNIKVNQWPGILMHPHISSRRLPGSQHGSGSTRWNTSHEHREPARWCRLLINQATQYQMVILLDQVWTVCTLENWTWPEQKRQKPCSTDLENLINAHLEDCDRTWSPGGFGHIQAFQKGRSKGLQNTVGPAWCLCRLQDFNKQPSTFGGF